MNNLFKNIFTVALLTTLTASLSFGQAKKNAGPLDGKKFIVVLVQDEKKEIPDEISFAAGKFKDAYFTKDWAFPAKPYNVTYVDSTSDGNKIYSFMYESANDNNEKIAMQGSIDGDNLEGTAEITNKKGKTVKTDRKSTRLNSSHIQKSRMPSSA